MVNFYPGVAGARGSNPAGIVFHNDAGSQAATAAFYKGWLPSHNAELGFAHDYVASDGTYHAEDYKNMAWHTANANGNRNYIGIEICQSLGDEAIFKNNEQKAFKLGAQICKKYGWKPSPDLFPLHKEFSSTTCPHRTWALHGSTIAKIRQYYADGVAKYMDGATVPDTPKPTPAPSVTISKWNKKQVVDVNGLQIRTSQTSNSASIGSLNKGNTFTATRIAKNGQNVNGYTTWFEVNGKGWVSGAYVTEVKSTKPNGFVAKNGTFKVKQTTIIRSAPSAKSTSVGSYAAGQSFNYDGYINAEGYRWYSYISNTNVRRYVADVGAPASSSNSSIKGSNLPKSGTYKFTVNTKIRYAPGINGKDSGQIYKKGQTVNYYDKVIKDGYVWLVYKGGSGKTCYVAVV